MWKPQIKCLRKEGRHLTTLRFIPQPEMAKLTLSIPASYTVCIGGGYLYCFIGFEVWDEKREDCRRTLTSTICLFTAFRAPQYIFTKDLFVWSCLKTFFSTSGGTVVQSVDFECTFKMEKTFKYLQIAAGCGTIYMPHAGRHKIQHPETVPATHWVLRTYLCL